MVQKYLKISPSNFLALKYAEPKKYAVTIKDQITDSNTARYLNERNLL